MPSSRLAASLAVLLEEDGPSDQAGALTTRATAALRGTGALRAGVPERWGGDGQPFRAAWDRIATLGEVSGAAAWVAALAYGSNLAGALLPAPGQEELWGSDPDAHVCGSFSPSGSARATDGGYRVDATVSTASGIRSAGWVMAMVLVDGTDEPVLVFVPVAAVEVDRTWDPAGLRASGSDSGTITDVFVPHTRVLAVRDFADGMARQALPVEAFGPVLLAAPLIGSAAAALEVARESLRSDDGGVEPRARRSDVRAAYADAAIALERADGLVGAALSDLGRPADAAGPGLDPAGPGQDPAVVRRSVTLTVAAVQEALTTARLAMAVVGSAALSRGHRSNRIWRDVDTGSRHTLLAPRALPARYVEDLEARAA